MFFEVYPYPPKKGECQLPLQSSQQMGKVSEPCQRERRSPLDPRGCRMGGHGGPEASWLGTFDNSYSKKSHCIHP